MASTTFVNGVTLSDADWFNDVNRLHYTIFGDPADAAAARTSLVTFASTYTPTITNGTNVAASTARLCGYIRIGDTVMVSGQVDIDPTATGTTQWTISLPVASNFVASNTTGSGGSGVSSNGPNPVYMEPDPATDTIACTFTASGTANQTISFNFQYRII